MATNAQGKATVNQAVLNAAKMAQQQQQQQQQLQQQGGIALDRYIAEDDDAPEPQLEKHIPKNKQAQMAANAQAAAAAATNMPQANIPLDRSKAPRKQQDGHTITISLLKPSDNFLVNEGKTLSQDMLATEWVTVKDEKRNVVKSNAVNASPALKRKQQQLQQQERKTSMMQNEEPVTVRHTSVTNMKKVNELPRSKVPGDQSGVYLVGDLDGKKKK